MPTGPKGQKRPADVIGNAGLPVIQEFLRSIHKGRFLATTV